MTCGVVHLVRHHQGSMMPDQYGGTKQSSVCVCVCVVAMNRLFLHPGAFLQQEQMRDAVFPFSLPLFSSYYPLVSTATTQPLGEKKKKPKTQHQNSRPELRLSHKKTKHPFNLSSYYIAIFSPFDLRTMARDSPQTGLSLQNPSHSAVPGF